jgi:hypothetical protein
VKLPERRCITATTTWMLGAIVAMSISTSKLRLRLIATPQTYCIGDVLSALIQMMKIYPGLCLEILMRGHEYVIFAISLVLVK